MSTESESAEQVVRLSLEGFEVVARLTGDMAKNFGAMLYALSKDTNKKTKGKTRLTNMLRQNSNLSIFSIKKEDYPIFKKEAKRYGILYHAVFNRNAKTSDGKVDLIIKEDDAVRVNRLVTRYNITRVDTERVEKMIDEKSNEEQETTDKPVIDKDVQAKNTSQDLINKLMKKQNVKEENENTNPSNLTGTEKNSPSENLLKQNERNERTNSDEKPSIHDQLERIKEQKAQEEKEQEKGIEETLQNSKQPKVNETIHEQPKVNSKKRKEKQK